MLYKKRFCHHQQLNQGCARADASLCSLLSPYLPSLRINSIQIPPQSQVCFPLFLCASAATSRTSGKTLIPPPSGSRAVTRLARTTHLCWQGRFVLVWQTVEPRFNHDSLLNTVEEVSNGGCIDVRLTRDG